MHIALAVCKPVIEKDHIHLLVYQAAAADFKAALNSDISHQPPPCHKTCSRLLIVRLTDERCAVAEQGLS